jgi:hypothetical protein
MWFRGRAKGLLKWAQIDHTNLGRQAQNLNLASPFSILRRSLESVTRASNLLATNQQVAGSLLKSSIDASTSPIKSGGPRQKPNSSRFKLFSKLFS